MKKIIIYVAMLIALGLGFLGVDLYCQNQSEILKTYEFNYRDLKTEGDHQIMPAKIQDGLWMEFIIPENKVWDDKTRQDDLFTGAQYDLYIYNESDYDFHGWNGVITMSKRCRVDSFWNMDCTNDGRNIEFTAKGDNSSWVKAGEQGKIGCILYTQHLAIPEKIVISGYFEYKPIQMPIFWGLCLLSLIWVIAVCVEMVVHFKTLHYEAELAEHANQAKSEFLSRMSHEIRTPMNAVVGITEIMLRDNLTAQQREYMEVLHHSSLALLDIINDILDFSKIEAGKMELVEAAYSTKVLFHDLQMILKNRAEQKHIELLFEIDDKLPEYLYGDELRIRQCIINLVNNSIKFTDKGSVMLLVKVEDSSENTVRVRIEVQDTGMGIKPEDLEKLFGAFEQLDTQKNHTKEGTGLGLSITQRLVELLGGQIKVESTYGQGSTFYFTINQQISSEKASVKRKLTSFIAPEAKVLIVDDNEINLEVATGLLGPMKMQLTIAKSGVEALEKIQNQHFDIIFMDQMMPVMDGTEAARRIRALPEPLCRIPVIALTASVTQRSKKMVLEAGMNDYVSKPIDMDIMKETLQKWLPTELVIEADSEVEAVEVKPESAVEIEGIDVTSGIKNCGSLESLKKLLGDYHKVIPMKSSLIRQYLDNEFWDEYHIEVHGLKSASRTVGAMELAREFEKLETYSQNEAHEAILSETEAVLQYYEEYINLLKIFSVQDNDTVNELTESLFRESMERILGAIEVFDIDTIDGEIENLIKYKLPDKYVEGFGQVQIYAADVDYSNLKNTIDDMLK